MPNILHTHGWPPGSDYLSRWNAEDLRTAMYRAHLRHPAGAACLRYLAKLLNLDLNGGLQDAPLGGWPEERTTRPGGGLRITGWTEPDG